MTPPYRDLIVAAAQAAGIDPALLEAVVAVESSYRADAFRYEHDFYLQYIKGQPPWDQWIPRRISASYGLTQIMAPTAMLHGFDREPEGLFVPAVNLEYGAKHLAHLLRWAHGDVYKALAAYNGGQGNWTAEKPQAYARKVLAKHGRLVGSAVPEAVVA